MTIPTAHRFSPYFAGLDGKTPEETAALESRIDKLAPEVRDFLFDGGLPAGVEAVVRESQLPEQYAVALTKMVFLMFLGDIPLASVGQLLQRLGVSTPVATRVSGGLDTLLEPLVMTRAAGTVPAMKQLPPLTQRIGAPTQQLPPPPAKATPSNVVDLRNKPAA